MTATRTDYQAVNARGTVLYTSPHLDLAKRWVSENAHLHAGLQVDEVQITVTRRRVYRPRPKPAPVKHQVYSPMEARA